jgi:hypothetical protein
VEQYPPLSASGSVYGRDEPDAAAEGLDAAQGKSGKGFEMARDIMRLNETVLG